MEVIPNILVDPARPKKGKPIFEKLNPQGIYAIRIWHAIPDKDSVIRSINLSHKQIVRKAKEKGMPEICIMEEDVWFPAPDGWQKFIEHKPEKYDLYLGGAYGLNNSALRRIQNEAGKEMIAAEVHNFAGLHCYFISENYYDRFLETPENKHIDDQAGNGKFYVCFPFVALQEIGWSSNNRHLEEVDYNAGIEQYIYYGKEEIR